MHAHKVKVVVSEDHQLTVTLPSDFPPGEAELIVLAGEAAEQRAGRAGAVAAADFETWLQGVLRRTPPAPVLPDEAFDRGSIYDE